MICKHFFQTNQSERNLPRFLNLIVLGNVKKACTALCKCLHRFVQENLIATFKAQATPAHSCSRAQTYSDSTGKQVNIIKLNQIKLKQEITQQKNMGFSKLLRHLCPSAYI